VRWRRKSPPPSQCPWPAPSQDSHQVCRGRSYSLRCIDAGCRKPGPLWLEAFGVAGPLVPNVPHRLSGSWSSPRTCAPRFLPTPPHGDALALRWSFGSTFTWTGDSHPPAVRHARHTRRGDERRRFSGAGSTLLFGLHLLSHRPLVANSSNSPLRPFLLILTSPPRSDTFAANAPSGAGLLQSSLVSLPSCQLGRRQAT
jgi:hypothetical protein